jgi:DNA-binding CsgD family transcriptional regulator
MGLRGDETMAKTVFARDMASVAAQLSLTPAAYELIHNVFVSAPQNDMALTFFFASFFVCSTLLTVLLRTPAGRALSSRRSFMILAPLLPLASGCLLGGLHAAIGGSDLKAAAYALLGGASAMSFHRMGLRMSEYVESRLAALAVCWLATNALCFWLCALMSMTTMVLVTLTANTLSIAICAAPAFSDEWRWRSRPVATADMAKSTRAASDNQSLLVKITANRYCLRYAGALALLGAVTATMTIVATSSNVQLDSAFRSEWLLIGVPVAAIIFAAPISVARSVNPLATFALLTLPGTIAFFPIAPGSYHSTAILISGLEVWAVCLLGATIMLDAYTSRQLQATGCYAYGLGLTSMAFGVLLSVLSSHLWHWQNSLRPDLALGTTHASIIGLVCVVAIYGATNLLVNSQALRKVILIGRGHIPTSLSFYDDPSQGGADGNGRPALLQSCCRLALDKGLSPRELEVLTVLAQGNSLQRVQEELVIAQGTAISHRRNIYRKLGVHSRQELLDLVQAERLT